MVAWLRRVFEIVKSPVRRPFERWREFFEYLTILGVCAAGLVDGTWLWIAIGAMALFLLGWPQNQELIAKAAAIDRKCRNLGSLRHTSRTGRNARGRKLPFVLVTTLGHDALFLACAFMLGHLIRWAWFVEIISVDM